MPRKRKIKAARIIGDIRSGMTVSQLMEKHGISARDLHIVLRKLLNGRAITQDELGGDTALYREAVGVKGIRQWLRQATILPVRVYDSADPSAKGSVRDISKKGVCIEGIEGSVGEVRNLILRSGAFGQGHTAVFEAKCRWANRDETFGRKWVAGFEITSISSLDARELEKLAPAALLRLDESPQEESVCLVPVYEEVAPGNRGAVCALTESRISVSGIETSVDEIKKLVIPADEFFPIPPFWFEASCRWIEEKDGHANSVAEFYITNISNQNRQRLKELIRLIKLPE